MNIETLKTVNFGEKLRVLIDNDPRGIKGYVEHFEVSRVSANNRTKSPDMKFQDIIATIEYFNVTFDEFVGTDVLEALMPDRYLRNAELNEIKALVLDIQKRLPNQA